MNTATTRTSLLLALALLPTVLFAATVPQDIGFVDMAFSGMGRPDCEGCHGRSLADRHHATAKATAGKCVDCHSVSTTAGKMGVGAERNCMQCHKETPHHQTKMAMERKCTGCHTSPGVSAFSKATPAYAPSKITPKRSSCKNCHGEGTVNGKKIMDLQSLHHPASPIGCDGCHDPENPTADNVRFCEQCHNVDAIHAVKPHLDKAACPVCHDVK